MRNLHHPSFSPVSLAVSAVGVLAVSYVGLIALVMSYAALTVEFTQSVRNDESAVAMLESAYLAQVAQITATDYAAVGYAKPAAIAYVPAESVTALR